MLFAKFTQAHAAFGWGICHLLWWLFLINELCKKCACWGISDIFLTYISDKSTFSFPVGFVLLIWLKSFFKEIALQLMCNCNYKTYILFIECHYPILQQSVKLMFLWLSCYNSAIKLNLTTFSACVSQAESIYIYLSEIFSVFFFFFFAYLFSLKCCVFTSRS